MNLFRKGTRVLVAWCPENMARHKRWLGSMLDSGPLDSCSMLADLE